MRQWNHTSLRRSEELFDAIRHDVLTERQIVHAELVFDSRGQSFADIARRVLFQCDQ